MNTTANLPIKSLPVANLNDTVIHGGFCVGCGICASVKESNFAIQMNKSGMFEAQQIEPGPIGLAESVCPFSDHSQNEDQIGKILYGKHCQYTDGIGYHAFCYAGHVNDDEIRMAGSSGGMGTWVLLKLLENGLIDGVAHVGGADGADGLPFAYKISTTKEQILRRAKSRYYPIEMSQVIDELRQLDGRFAVVGLPCFIKGIRLLAKRDQQINDRVAFTVALFCGHLKSKYFADFFGWQAGIQPGELESINFRTKLPARPASDYGITVSKKDLSHCRENSAYACISWGYGFFKYKACDYCDDVVGETADISVGDAWLSQYVSDSSGTNVVVVRNKQIAALVEEAIAVGDIQLDSIDASLVIESQEAGLRHRREGLAYRLQLRDSDQVWRPKKRVDADSKKLTTKQKKIFELREKIAALSHIAFQDAIDKKSLDRFTDQMRPSLIQYDRLYEPNAIRKLKSILFKFLSRIKKTGISICQKVHRE